jgi:hypothetical protein
MTPAPGIGKVWKGRGSEINVRKDEGPRLRLIRSSYPYQTKLGSIDLVASPQDRPPFKADAVAVEEDTFLVMSADRRVRDAREPLMKVMTRVIETRPQTPGTVLVRGKSPLRFLAIVHDLNEEPSLKEEWIRTALEGIFREAEKRKLRSIALPFLGTLHGSLGKERFVSLLRCTVEQISTSHLKRLWLVVPPKTSPKVLCSLKGD